MTKKEAREIIMRLSSEAEKAGEMEDMEALDMAWDALFDSER